MIQYYIAGAIFALVVVAAAETIQVVMQERGCAS